MPRTKTSKPCKAKDGEHNYAKVFHNSVTEICLKCLDERKAQ